MSVIVNDPQAERQNKSGQPKRGALQADVSQLTKFCETIFRNCADVEGWIALRAFEHADDGRVAAANWVKFGPGLIPAAAEMATGVANRSYDRRAVFCPPVCVFGDEKRQGKRTAAASNVVCGPAIAVELDARPADSLGKLRGALGEPTLIVRSGGLWQRSAGGFEPKVHAYWRLAQPAQSAEDQARLKYARQLATALVDGDKTAAPLPHPMRWPGSWHTKDVQPRLCEIDGGDPDRDVDLGEAIGWLEFAAHLQGIDIAEAMDPVRPRNGFKTKTPMPADFWAKIVEALPNDGGVQWADWNRIGMAFFDASHGDDDGLEAFHSWSAKSDAYDGDETDQRWAHWMRYPPSDLSAGTLIHEVRKAVPGFSWRAPETLPADWYEEVEDDAAHLPKGDRIDEINQRFCFVLEGGKARCPSSNDLRLFGL